MTVPPGTGVIADDVVVELHPLHIGPDEGGVCEVGRTETGVFVELPVEGVDLLRWLGAGFSAGEVRRRFADRYGTEPDLTDFLTGIGECGFVRADGDPAPGGATRGLRLLAGLRQERVAWLLAPAMRVLYAAVWLAVPALLLVAPELRPRPADAILSDRTVVSAVTVLAVATVLVLFHEMAHATAVRALGVTGRLSLSRRMWFLVAQTEMSGVRSVPRHRRYAPYLAGMTWDLALMTCCLLLQLAGAGGPVARLVVYTLTLSLVFQLSVFMRTDMYFVIANRLRVADLHGDTRRLLSNLVRRWLGRTPRHDLTAVPDRELRIIRWYLPCYLAGSAAVTALFVALTVPATVRLVGLAVAGVGTGPDTLAFWDGVGLLTLLTVQFGALGWVWAAERRHR